MANKYITVANADLMYTAELPTVIHVMNEDGDFELFDVWADSTSIEKEQSLIQSSKFIDSFEYDGYKTVESQDREFPRNGDIETPAQIKKATFELAMHFIRMYHINNKSNPLVQVAKQSGMSEYQQVVAEDREVFKFAEDSMTPRSILLPYVRKWIKGNFRTTRYSR